MENEIQKVKTAILTYDVKNIKEIVKSALESGADPQKILDDGMIFAMDEIGQGFKENRIYMPQMLVAAKAMQAGLEVLKPLLAGDGTYECLMTVPGIGPRTASELVIAIRIEDFPDHDHLASYCGVAPRNRQSGTSISSVSASRQGNKRLKNLLVFSCNSLVRSSSRFGEYYRRCRDRGMCHGEALKAVARKRLKVIYAIMRDKVPYTA